MKKIDKIKSRIKSKMQDLKFDIEQLNNERKMILILTSTKENLIRDIELSINNISKVLYGLEIALLTIDQIEAE